MTNQLLICAKVPNPHFDRTEVEDYNVVTFGECQGKVREEIVLKRPTLLRARMWSSTKSAI
ncbi:hypothetical protein YTPLAS72_04430 [Nitrospira sp.]|nr:hypothetical protein YTPLAS72_04430 [Nitrospira sp.]